MVSRITTLIVALVFLFLPHFTLAIDPSYQATVSKIVEQKNIDVFGTSQIYQKIELSITSSDKKGQVITIENGDQPLANIITYKVGDRVYLSETSTSEGTKEFQITDFVRQDALFLLFIIFTVLTIVVARFKGFSSMISMVLTFVILFAFVLPQISHGKNPVFIAIISSILIIPISFYMSHGVNRKTSAAILGSIISLSITSLLAYIFIRLTHLTGFSTEEAGMLSIDRRGLLDMKGLLLSGIVVGTLGVLDDITVSQAAIADELSKVGQFKKVSELYSRTMVIGTDHITSMVNTLVLAYAGASLPLLLMFVDNPQPIMSILNNEMIAEEIVRTLIGSIGLIVAVPITTYIAAKWFHR
jgi:uncharacterized membrane protein